MNGIEAFVRARLADRDLPDQVTRTYTDLLELSVTIRSDGESDDWISWLTAPSAIVKIGEYALGADPDSVANRISDGMCAAMARTWDGHPDHDPERNRLLS